MCGFVGAQGWVVPLPYVLVGGPQPLLGPEFVLRFKYVWWVCLPPELMMACVMHSSPQA